MAWQVFDSSGASLLSHNVAAPALPVWGLVAAFPTPTGDFVIVY